MSTNSRILFGTLLVFIVVFLGLFLGSIPKVQAINCGFTTSCGPPCIVQFIPGCTAPNRCNGGTLNCGAFNCPDESCEAGYSYGESAYQVYSYGESGYYGYGQSAYYGYGQSSYYAYSQSAYYGYGQSSYYGYGQSAYVGYSYSQSAYYSYSQSAYYAYSQSAYYAYTQSAYVGYSYSQSAYYSYSQSTYYSYSQAAYAPVTQNGYRVQIDDDPAFGSPIIDSCPSGSGCAGGQSTLYQIPQGILAFNTVYYARVMVWDSNGGSTAWSNMVLCNGYPAGTVGGCQTSSGGVPVIGFGGRWKTPANAFPDIQQSTGHNPTFSPSSPVLNSSVQFTDRTLFSGSGPNTWLWTFGDTTTSTLQNPTHAYSVAGAFQVTLKATDASGLACTSSPITIPVGQAVPVWKEVIPR